MHRHIVCLCSSFDAFSLHAVALSSTVLAMLALYISTILLVFRRNIAAPAPVRLYAMLASDEVGVAAKSGTRRPFALFET